MERSIAIANEQVRPQSQEKNATVRLLLLMLIPVALSMLFFSGQSLRLDEAQSLWQTSRSATDILTLIAQDVHVPLYHELLHFWRLFVGDSVGSARLMSLTFYLLSIPALYMVGRLIYGRSAGLFAATLLAISPFMNWYGNEIRMYTLFTLLVILNQFFFLKIMRKEESDGIWIGYITTAVLGVFSHYFFFINLLAQGVFYFMRKDLFAHVDKNKFILSIATVCLLFFPWAMYVFLQGQIGFSEPVLPTPDSTNLFSTIAQFLFGFQDDHLNTFFLSLWPITLVFLFLTLRHNRRITPETEYLLVTVIFSVLLVFFASFITPIFVSRYLIFTVPALYLLLASMFNNYSPVLALFMRRGVVTIILFMLALEILNPTAPVKEDYRSAAEYLTVHTTPQDVVVLSAPFTVYPVEYYYRGAATIETLPRWNQYAYGPIPAFSADELPEQVKNITEPHQNVYVLLSYDQGYEEEVRQYFDSNFEKLTSQNFSPGLNLYVYKVRYDTKNSQITGSF